MQVQSQVGPIATTQSIAPGTVVALRSGQLGDTIVSELHGRFYEQTYRGNVYTGGITAVTALSTNTITLTATTTPILGLWNNLSNAVLSIQGSLQRKGWSRILTPCMHNEKPVNPSSRARSMRAGIW